MIETFRDVFLSRRDGRRKKGYVLYSGSGSQIGALFPAYSSSYFIPVLEYMAADEVKFTLAPRSVLVANAFPISYR
jgi:hypothetical protein